MKILKKIPIYSFFHNKLVYHNWEKVEGNFSYHLTFQFCRIQSAYYLFNRKLPFGQSIFIKKILTFAEVVKETVWYLPFIHLKPIAVKYHFSSPLTDKLISFSMSPTEINPKCIPYLLNDRIIQFKYASTNSQPLLTYKGEIYPSQDKYFHLLKPLNTPEELEQIKSKPHW